MPAASRQAAEHCRLGGHLIEMKRLRVELTCEPLDLGASGTPGDFFQQLPALRSQFKHRGGPGHEQSAASGSADDFTRQSLPLSHIAAGDSPVAESSRNVEM